MTDRQDERGGMTCRDVGWGRVRKTVARLCLCAVAMALSSCFESREEYWLERDGGGRAEIRYVFPTAVARLHGGDAGLRKMIARFLQETPAITSSGYEVASDGGRTQVRLRIGFASALDLKELAAGPAIRQLPGAASHLAGEIQAGIRGRTLEFSRTIRAGRALPGAGLLPASSFAGQRMVYIVHLPAAAMETNATQVLDGGRTLIWDIPVAQALEGPVITHFKMQIPIPWKIACAITLGITLLGGLAARRLRTARANKSA